jgi:hypothetical protein
MYIYIWFFSAFIEEEPRSKQRLCDRIGSPPVTRSFCRGATSVFYYYHNRQLEYRRQLTQRIRWIEWGLAAFEQRFFWGRQIHLFPGSTQLYHVRHPVKWHVMTFDSFASDFPSWMTFINNLSLCFRPFYIKRRGDRYSACTFQRLRVDESNFAGSYT